MTQTPVFLGIGSNLGDRETLVGEAVRLLSEHPAIDIVERSALYETEPVGVHENQRHHPDHPWYVNAVVSAETSLRPDELLDACMSIEQRLGRRRDPNNQFAPRFIDIDILFFGDWVVQQPDLLIPHPRLHERAFTLIPLLELAPDWFHPVYRKNIRQLRQELESDAQIFSIPFLYKKRDT